MPALSLFPPTWGGTVMGPGMTVGRGTGLGIAGGDPIGAAGRGPGTSK